MIKDKSLKIAEVQVHVKKEFLDGNIVNPYMHAEQSSNYDDKTDFKKRPLATNAIDRKRLSSNEFNGNWFHNVTSSTKWESNPYWILDLGEMREFESIIVHSRTDWSPRQINEAKIDIFDDKCKLLDNPYNNTDIIGSYSISGVDYGSTSHIYKFGNKIQGRYIRISHNSPGKDKILQIAEVEVYNKYSETFIDKANTLLGTWNEAFQLEEIAVKNDIVYAHDARGEVNVLDISDPNQIKKLTSFTCAMFSKLVSNDNDLYVLGIDGILQKHDITNPKAPKLEKSISLRNEDKGIYIHNVKQIEIKGDYLYITYGSKNRWEIRLSILDLSILDDTNTLDDISKSDFANYYDNYYIGRNGFSNIDNKWYNETSGKFAVKGDFVYLSYKNADVEGFLILEIEKSSTQLNIQKKDIIDVDHRVISLAVKGDLLFANDMRNNLIQFNISDPIYPELMISISLPNKTWNYERMKIRDTHILLSDNNYVSAIDLATFDPNNVKLWKSSKHVSHGNVDFEYTANKLILCNFVDGVQVYGE